MSLEEDKSSQEDEMMVMESILEESGAFVRYPDLNTSGKITVEMNLPDGFFVYTGGRATDLTKSNSHDAASSLDNVPQADDQSTMEDTFPEKCHINHLPPLIIHFTLPDNYPSTEKPLFTLASTWLDRCSVCHNNFY